MPGCGVPRQVNMCKTGYPDGVRLQIMDEKGIVRFAEKIINEDVKTIWIWRRGVYEKESITGAGSADA